jgi:ribosomal-protein-alanine N-acetyltransferase
MLDLERRCSNTAHWSQQQYEDLFGSNANGPRRLVLMMDESADAVERGSKPGNFRSARSPTLGFLVANQIGLDWELENIVIAPASRRKGLATRLLTALLTRARETNSDAVFLEVRESNHAARALYGRLGFEESGRRTRYYANPEENAVLYRLTLKPRSTRFESGA